MYSQSALVHEDKQRSTAHLGGRAAFRAGTAWKWQWCHEKQIGFGLRTLWASFFSREGCKSRLQCWGCMCPAPRAMTKNMGHSFTHTYSVTHMHAATHTRAYFFSLFISVFSLSLIISSIIKSGEKLIIFGSQCPCRCSFWHNTRGEQTKSICRDLNLLIPLANCENNHLKITLRKIWFIYFHFSAPRINYTEWSFSWSDAACVIKEYRVITGGLFYIWCNILIDSRAFHASHDQAEQHVTHHRDCIWFHY